MNEELKDRKDGKSQGNSAEYTRTKVPCQHDLDKEISQYREVIQGGKTEGTTDDARAGSHERVAESLGNENEFSVFLRNRSTWSSHRILRL